MLVRPIIQMCVNKFRYVCKQYCVCGMSLHLAWEIDQDARTLFASSFGLLPSIEMKLCCAIEHAIISSIVGTPARSSGYLRPTHLVVVVVH